MVYQIPEKVAEGLRDYIAWECHTAAQVDVSANRGGGYTVKVTMNPKKAKPNRRELERDLAGILPQGFTLTMNWDDER